MGVPVVGKAMRKMFGSRNERMVKRYMQIVDQVGSHEDDVRKLSDAELRARTEAFRERIAGGESPKGMIPEVFAVAREVMDRNVGIRNIFNPELEFDPSVLPDDAQRIYMEVKAEIERTPPADPEEFYLGCAEPVPAWQFVDIPTRLYEAVREAYPESRPPYRARPFDVQIIGGVVLYEGRIAEMKTGEGKTIVAPLAAYLAALEDKQVHVVTVNSYLVQRDRDWTFPFFRALGLTVGAIHPVHAGNMEEFQRLSKLKHEAYKCNVVYGTTAEFGFDYLRDNMKLNVAEQLQKRRDFAIVDEVDSTLVDEARTPLIISGQAHQSQPRYELADQIARHLVEMQKQWSQADQRVQSCLVDISGHEGDIRNARDKSAVPAIKAKLDEARKRLEQLEAERDKYTQYYEVELDKKKANLTHNGIAEAQKKAGVGSFYVGDNIDIPHLLEQAVRAHTVYMRDRDYVVAPGDDGNETIVIVDQNTGRKMPGRQWSDGLHQAVEAKEGVPIKEETQTMATITIQNFFKLYGRLAGMTGTADTEATEFYEIYKLDVVVIPTNVPVVRDDHNDLVFISEKDKWDAIVDEIKHHHDLGQPVLVGTTSVEKSETLSQMLTRKYNIEHAVLNAKQHEREAEIILDAGRLGAVMIATNMAGRGTDIKLSSFTRQDLIDHWKKRGICPRDITPDTPEDEAVTKIYRQLATREAGLKKRDVESMSDEQCKLAVLRYWFTQFCYGDESKADSLNEKQLIDELDKSGMCVLHRIGYKENVNQLGGLHVVATERHESRRIDNQLRGRSGRQGDNGSSRFFLSLEDDLMKMFAGKTTLNVLSRLGMKEGDAIEHPMLTKAVGRAQRKVEERNFLIRKQILEYDEVMDHQRHDFYGMRQDILEGRNIKESIFEYLDESTRDAVSTYLDKNHAANCIAEWVRENLNASIDPDRIRNKSEDRDDLYELIRRDGKEEASNNIVITIGEYLPEDTDTSEWDHKGLADWAKAAYGADLKISEIRDMSTRDIITAIEKSGHQRIDEADLSPIDQYLVPHYGARELARWAENKFTVEVDPEQFFDLEETEPAMQAMQKLARDAYRERELSYPIEFAMDMTAMQLQQDSRAALDQFCRWAQMRYQVHWTPNTLPSSKPTELKEILLAEAKRWDESRIEERAEQALAKASTPEELDAWFKSEMNASLSPEQLERAADDPKTVAEERIAEAMRLELTHFERWVLLQIIDQAWKDHLYAMDQVKESIGFRSFSQQDPRIEFKREGARLYDEMHETIRNKVTDLIFKAKLTPHMNAPSQQRQQPPSPQEDGSSGEGRGPAPGSPQVERRPVSAAQPATAAAVAAAAAAGTDRQRRDLEQAEQAGASQQSERRKPQPRRAGPTIGRNEMVTIVNPATGEKETLKYKKAQDRINNGWRLVAK